MTNDNYAIATGNLTFSNYNLPSEPLILTTTETIAVTKALERGIAVADGLAISYSDFANDTNFTTLFTESIVAGGGTSSGTANSSAEIVAGFSVKAGEKLSFDIATIIETQAKELEKNAKSEYNEAKSTVGFLLLKKEDFNKFSVIDYAGIEAELISSERTADLTITKSNSLKITSSLAKSQNIGGNNRMDYLKADLGASYEKTFNQNTDLILVKVTKSYTTFVSDAKILEYDKLGYITGSIRDDVLFGTLKDDHIYASFGNDTIFGTAGNNVIDGGYGDDILYSGTGNDILKGSSGADQFVLTTNPWSNLGQDIILDFTPGEDKILLIDSSIDYSYGPVGAINQSQLNEINYDTTTGALSYKGNEIAILLGVSQLTSGDFLTKIS